MKNQRKDTKVDTPEEEPGMRNEASKPPFTGQCYCGAVKYVIDAAILEHNFCNCGSCQKAHGALAVPWIVVPGGSFKITQGEVKKTRFEPGTGCDCHGARSFCPICGGQVYWQRDIGSEVDVCAMTLDDFSNFRGKE
jgi:hypothetical protein